MEAAGGGISPPLRVLPIGVSAALGWRAGDPMGPRAPVSPVLGRAAPPLPERPHPCSGAHWAATPTSSLGAPSPSSPVPGALGHALRWALDKAWEGRRPPTWQGIFRARPGCGLPGVWMEPAWLRSELRFRPCSVVLNIAAREGSFRLQPPPPPPSAGKSMPAPSGPAAVPADLPHQAAEQNEGAGPHPSPGALPLAPRLPLPSPQLLPGTSLPGPL